MDKGSIFYTIGHSTRSVTELVRLLRGVGADFIVDVRSIPRSRTNSQFNADTLPDTLAGERIGYRHVARLGGLRGRHKGQALSGNGFWQNASFRNYADYAATPDFGAGMAELYDIGRDHVCACVRVCVRVPSCAPRRFGGAVIAASSPIICSPTAIRCSTSWGQGKSSAPT